MITLSCGHDASFPARRCQLEHSLLLAIFWCCCEPSNCALHDRQLTKLCKLRSNRTTDAGTSHAERCTLLQIKPVRHWNMSSMTAIQPCC
jgi:hypothetical protein